MLCFFTSTLGWSTTVLAPNVIYKGESAQISSIEIMNSQKAITSNIEVVFSEPDSKKCKRVGSVRTSKPIELWQKADACIIRHLELKRQTVLLQGSLVFVDPIQDCEKNVFEGQAYCCYAVCKSVRFK